MKNVLRDWLGINEEKYQLELEIDRLRVDLANKDANLEGLDDELQDLRGELETIEYRMDDKVEQSDLEDSIQEEIDYESISDSVFDLVMEEIKNRDTLQSLVEDKLNAMADESRGSGGEYSDSMVTSIIEEVTDEVMEKIIYKLRA